MPTMHESRILLDHGAGGKLSHDLVVETIIPNLGNVHLGRLEDSRILPIPHSHIAMTTDTFVLQPIFLGNGNIGHLAVAGTVNDLSVSGGLPLYLTLGLVLEEGFLINDLVKIIRGVADAATMAGVAIVAGDTKVVRRGEADGIFINTAGVAAVSEDQWKPSPVHIRPGDQVIVTGTLGDHSIHVLSLRHGLGYQDKIQSDWMPLNNLISHILRKFGQKIHFIRDITRGGIGTLLNEVVPDSCHITIQEDMIPISSSVRMASEMLGVSPLYLANDGKLCLFVDPQYTENVLDDLRIFPEAKNAAVIGEVCSSNLPGVTIIDVNGISRQLEFLHGAELPRLC